MSQIGNQHPSREQRKVQRLIVGLQAFGSPKQQRCNSKHKIILRQGDNILVENQFINIKWNSLNKSYYTEIGYQFTKFGDVFTVNVEDLPITNKSNVSAICDICGSVKTVNYNSYCRNVKSNSKYVCHKCSTLLRYDRELKDKQIRYMNRLAEQCTVKGYKLLSVPSDIRNNTSYIKYECPKHGVKSMRISNFLNGKGCPDCAKDTAASNYKFTAEEVAERIGSYGVEVLNPEDYINQYEKNLKFVCPICGEIFITSLLYFTQHGGKVCDGCTHKISQGERRIYIYLKEHNITFEREKRFAECKDERPLPFDFFLPEYNMCIEFDGQQHYSGGFFPTDLAYTESHDKIKTDYCKSHNIRILRIPYWDMYHIQDILTKELHQDIV